MKRVLALTAIETPFRGNLIMEQFLRPLIRGCESPPDQCRLSYLALTPALFHFSKRTPWRTFESGRDKRRALRQELSDNGVPAHFRLIPYPVHPKDFNLTRARARVFIMTAAPVFLSHLLMNRPDVVVCRSYPAAMLARLGKKLLGVPYVFDLRGMYPEECTNAGAFNPGSTDYHYWKRQERKLIGDATTNLVVSDPFQDYLLELSPGVSAKVNYCCVNQERFGYDPDKRLQAKRQHGLEGRFVLLHLGSFGTPGDRGLVAQYALRFRRVRPEAVLVVASGTPLFGRAIRDAFLAQGLAEEAFRIVHPQGDQLAELLALGDAGLLLERKVVNTRVCLSVKLGEYLASGLPVICTPHVEGAVRLVRQYDCGLVVDPDAGEPLELELDFLDRYHELQQNGLRLARERLSLDRCAAVWREVLHQHV